MQGMPHFMAKAFGRKYFWAGNSLKVKFLPFSQKLINQLHELR